MSAYRPTRTPALTADARAGQVANGRKADRSSRSRSSPLQDGRYFLGCPFALRNPLLAYAGKQSVELLHLLWQSGRRAL